MTETAPEAHEVDPDESEEDNVDGETALRGGLPAGVERAVVTPPERRGAPAKRGRE